VDHTHAVRFLHAYIPQGDGYQQEDERQYCSCYNPVTAATINCGDRKRIWREGLRKSRFHRNLALLLAKLLQISPRESKIHGLGGYGGFPCRPI